MVNEKGLFIVIDGLDGIGKGEIERALIEYEQKLGRSVFDSVAFSNANKKGLPELKDFWDPPNIYFDTIITAEPTYSGIGRVIRNEIIKKGSLYSSETQITAYSLDRLISMVRVIIPALKNNLRVIQSRSFISTITYQSLKAQEEGKDFIKIRNDILKQKGNQVQIKWMPDLIIIPTIKDMNELMERLEKRKEYKKDDNSIFDDLEFQSRLKKFFEDPWLKKFLEKHGAKVEYLDAGISEASTREQAVKIYKNFLESKKF